LPNERKKQIFLPLCPRLFFSSRPLPPFKLNFTFAFYTSLLLPPRNTFSTDPNIPFFQDLQQPPPTHFTFSHTHLFLFFSHPTSLFFGNIFFEFVGDFRWSRPPVTDGCALWRPSRGTGLPLSRAPRCRAYASTISGPADGDQSGTVQLRNVDVVDPSRMPTALRNPTCRALAGRSRNTPVDNDFGADPNRVKTLFSPCRGKVIHWAYSCI